MIYQNLKNLDTIYSSKHGRGMVVSVTWRRDDQLLMCYFPGVEGHLFITSDEFEKDTSFSFRPFKIRKEDLKENVVKEMEGKFKEETET
jgi:hypothetical protein